MILEKTRQVIDKCYMIEMLIIPFIILHMIGGKLIEHLLATLDFLFFVKTTYLGISPHYCAAPSVIIILEQLD